MYDKTVLSEKIAHNITQMILEKELKPGDKLPNELELTKNLNVSRSTVREAIKILASTNILEIKRGKGTFVSKKPGVAKDPLGVTFMEQKDLILYLFETRLIIEPNIAALAAERAIDTDIIRMEEAFLRLKKDIKNYDNHTNSDIKFHNAIAKASHNPFINRIVPIINDCISKGYLETKDIPESGDEVIRYHEIILRAIKNKNIHEAKKAMNDHIMYGMNEVKKKLRT